MHRNAAGLGRVGIFALVSGAILSVALWLTPMVKADDAAGNENKKIAELIALGHKFLGSTSCKSCHGGDVDPTSPAKAGSELTVWSTLDKHHESYSTLSSDRSKDIATKGGYGDAINSTKCLSCHGLVIPAAQQGPDFKIAEGNTCDACHGPSELWSGSDGSPHKTPGWAEKRREADGYDARAAAATDGFWDVRIPGLRAENCASCHLAIDAKMVAAGHPQPAFELNEYASQEPKHWTDKRGDQYYTQLWAAGQIVCTRDSMIELAKRCSDNDNADVIKTEWNQAMAHATMLDILAGTDGGVGSDIKDDLEKNLATLKDSAGTDATKIKDPASAIALLADKVLTTELKDFAPDVTATGALLQKVLDGSDDMAKNYDRRGAEQAAYAARWLYLSKSWDSDTKHELPDDLVAEYKGFFDNRALPLGDDAAKFADAITKIKANP
jgi:Cytochrome c554 and c-prime